MLFGADGQPIQPQALVPDTVDTVHRAVADATSDLFDKIDRIEKSLVSTRDEDDGYGGKAKGWFTDPFALLDSYGMGYRANPSAVTYETLRQMTERDNLLAAIIGTRIAQVSAFCREQENKYSIGYKIRPRKGDKTRQLTDSEKDRVSRIIGFLACMGKDDNVTRDGFVNFVKKIVRDRLTFDQMNFEKVFTRGGDLFEVLAHDAATMRIAQQRDVKGAPVPTRIHNRHVCYVQILNGEIVTEFTPRELSFCVANPRSSVRVAGYGFPEPQQLIQTITAHIWAEEWNRKMFSQGSTIKGVLNMKGNINRQTYEGFKRQWTAQVGGVNNAWRTPILNSEGVEFVPLQLSNTEMGYQMWLEYLVKVATAIYQMDPSEVNFDLRGSQGQQPVFMTNNEAQQKLSKDRGLKPLLRFLEDSLNRHVIWLIDEDFELAFVGLDAGTEEQAIELRQKQGATMLTINELRALEDLPPVPHGDIIANPAFIQYVQQQQMAQQQGGGGGAPPPGGGGGPQMPGMPGQEPTPPQQPYAGKLGNAGDQPTESAKDAGKKLQDANDVFAEKKPKKKEEHAEAPYMRFLRQNDWDETVHSSLSDSDLKKSEDTYYDIEL